MNERIQELMNQAMESNGVEGIGGAYYELNPEKFADLIIQECADLFTGIYTDQHRPQRIDTTIKNYFGVEE